jgi:hypothetical protein
MLCQRKSGILPNIDDSDVGGFLDGVKPCVSVAKTWSKLSETVSAEICGQNFCL